LEKATIKSDSNSSTTVPAEAVSMSASITRSIVRKQLLRDGLRDIRVGILLGDGRMSVRKGWTAEQIDAAISWFRQEYARGANISVRPEGAHGTAWWMTSSLADRFGHLLAAVTLSDQHSDELAAAVHQGWEFFIGGLRRHVGRWPHRAANSHGPRASMRSVLANRRRAWAK